MPKRGGAVHVTSHRRHYVGKDGRETVYETHLLRRSWREDGKVRNETVANLSHLPGALIELISRSLKGEAFVPAGQAATVTRSLPHGHVAAVWAQAKALGFPALPDPAGRPVAVRVFEGNTADPTAFTEAVETVRTKFGLQQMVMVGDRGMITSARIDALKELGGLGWLTCLRAPAIAKLATADGPLQLSLFDQADLAEIAHPDYPGERLIACRNPALAAERTRKRTDLLTATENLLAPIAEAVTAGRLHGADKIG